MTIMLGIIAGIATGLAATVVAKVAGLYKPKSSNQKIDELQTVVHQLGLDSSTSLYDSAVSHLRTRIFGNAEAKRSA